MSIFQKAADFIKSIKSPKWYKILMREIQDIIIAIMIRVGKDYVSQLQSHILEVSKMDMSNEKKFRMVFNYGKELIPSIKDSALNLLIETLINRLKTNKV